MSTRIILTGRRFDIPDPMLLPASERIFID